MVVLCMKCVLQLIQAKDDSHKLQGVVLGMYDPFISHIFFADDSLLVAMIIEVQNFFLKRRRKKLARKN